MAKRRRKRGRGRRKSELKAWRADRIKVQRKELESFVLSDYLSNIGRLIRRERVFIKFSDSNLMEGFMFNSPVDFIISPTSRDDLLRWTKNDWLTPFLCIRPMTPVKVSSYEHKLYIKASSYRTTGILAYRDLNKD